MKTNNANKTQRLKSRRAKLLITVLVACLLISMFPLSSFSSSGMPWWFYPPPEGYVPRINPVSFEVFLTQEYSLLDIGDIRLMFDGMGIRSITDRNGKLIKDPDLPKDFQRLLILFTEEQGVSSVIDAVARVGMLSFVSEARLLWSSTYLFGSQNPPEGAFSPGKSSGCPRKKLQSFRHGDIGDLVRRNGVLRNQGPNSALLGEAKNY